LRTPRRPTRLAAVRFTQRDILPFVLGLSALPAQAILMRELLARGGGNEIILTFYLAVWLAGSGSGARLWGTRQLRIGALILFGPAIATVSLVIARLLPSFGSIPGEMPRPAGLVLTAAIVLYPSAFLTAGLFPVAANTCTSIRRAYLAEACGAMAGGIATTVLLVFRRSPLEILALASATGLILLLSPRARVRWAIPAILLALTFAGVVGNLDGLLFVKGWEDRHPGLRLAAAAATPSRMLVVAEREGERWLLVDDHPREVLRDAFRGEAVAALLLAAPPSPPRRVLLVDFGGTDVASALERAGVQEIFCIVPDREDTSMAGVVPGVRYRVGDPRHNLRTVPGKWDVIALAGGEETTVSANRLWTEDAFREMAGRLADSGVIVAMAPGGAAAPGAEADAWRGSIAAGLESATGSPPAANAGDNTVFVASRPPRRATLDPDSLSTRYVRAGAPLPTYPAARFAAEYPRDRAVRWSSSSTTPNRDMRPVAFAHALARWLRMSGIPLPPAWVLVVFCLLLIASPAFADPARSALMATGAASMGLDLMVLMAFQSRVGILQGGLGAILGAFLGGTAIGAWLSDWKKIGIARLCLIQAFAAAIVTILLPWIPGDPVAFAALGFVIGSTCGAPFPAAAAMLGAGRAWAADALGGVIGALLFLVVVSTGFLTTGFALSCIPAIAAARILLATGNFRRS
jgi:hypothetical protein